MAFRRINSRVHKNIVELTNLAITNAQVVSAGMLLTISKTAGTVQKMATGNECLGCLENCPAALTGVADGSVKAGSVEADPGAIYAVPQSPIADANSAIGCTLDIAADALSLAAAVNDDFRVYSRWVAPDGTKMLGVVPLSRAFPC